MIWHICNLISDYSDYKNDGNPFAVIVYSTAMKNTTFNDWNGCRDLYEFHLYTHIYIYSIIIIIYHNIVFVSYILLNGGVCNNEYWTWSPPVLWVKKKKFSSPTSAKNNTNMVYIGWKWEEECRGIGYDVDIQGKNHFSKMHSYKPSPPV